MPSQLAHECALPDSRGRGADVNDGPAWFDRKAPMARELVYAGFISLDGVADFPGGSFEGRRSGGWVVATEVVADASHWRW